MFAIGDKIVYPMHGAGVIEDMEEKKILGETRDYFVLRIATGGMKIMVPVASCEEIGVRHVMEEEELEKVFEVLRGESSEMSSNWNRRYRENMEELKSGDARVVAAVIRNLTRIDRVKKLSTGERKMLANAKQILLSEIVLIRDVSEREASEMIDEEI